MNFNQLTAKIAAISDRDYLLYPAGIPGLFHLGETGRQGLHLIDANKKEILDFIEKNTISY